MEVENKKLNLELNNLLILYRHYKDYFLSVAVILISIMILFFVIIPQFQQYFSSLRELKAETQKLEVLKTNYSFLSNLDEVKSNSDLKILSLVLPSDKDFAGMINAISYASAKTGVAVGDFSFSVGNLSGSTLGGVTVSPSIKIDVNLNGSSNSIIQFVTELYKTAPACEVTSIKINGDSGSITIFFYYKPFVRQEINEENPITSLSQENLALIDNVSSWNNTKSQSVVPLIPAGLPTSATASAEGSLRTSSSSPF